MRLTLDKKSNITSNPVNTIVKRNAIVMTNTSIRQTLVLSQRNHRYDKPKNYFFQLGFKRYILSLINIYNGRV